MSFSTSKCWNLSLFESARSLKNQEFLSTFQPFQPYLRGKPGFFASFEAASGGFQHFPPIHPPNGLKYGFVHLFSVESRFFILWGMLFDTFPQNGRRAYPAFF
jgi:hypothetical protein